VESIFGPLGGDAGVPEVDILEAERRLGVLLPQTLRELYHRTGRVATFHAAHNRLVPLDEIDFSDDHLTFYEENQNVVVWGIARARLSEPDPPVDQGQPPRADGERWDFYSEFRSVSEFIRAQAAWQAVQGGLPFGGVMLEFAQFGAVAAELGAPALELEGMR